MSRLTFFASRKRFFIVCRSTASAVLLLLFIFSFVSSYFFEFADFILLIKQTVKAMINGVLKQWKKDNDYHQRSLSETGMYRYKQLNSPKLTLRDYNAQVGEALAGVKAMNKVIGLGMPVRATVN